MSRSRGENGIGAFFVIPRILADAKARRDKPTSKTANERYWRIDEVAKIFTDFEGNFALKDVAP